jgi:hypothetical protein
MADKSPLRRWKPFFPAFGAIDACIEAAAPEGCSRDKYRQVRGDIVEMLCDAAGDEDDDDGRAEELCRLLDVAMAEALETLRVVPVTPAMLTTTDVAKAVGGLLGHESVRVRGLARAVVSGWRASLEAALGTLLQISLDEHEVAAAAPPVTGCVPSAEALPLRRHWFKAGDIKQAARMSDMECPNPKKMPPGVPWPWRRSRQERGDDSRQAMQSANTQERIQGMQSRS